MKLREEVDPAGHVKKGFIGVNNDAARDNINVHLASVTACACITPYIALERVRKVLAQFHIFLPKIMFLDGEHGVETFPTNQFGEVMGMRDDGKVVNKVPDPYHVYFEYQMNERGMFDVFCEIVNQEELEDLLDDVESDMNDEDVEDDREEKLNENMTQHNIPSNVLSRNRMYQHQVSPNDTARHRMPQHNVPSTTPRATPGTGQSMSLSTQEKPSSTNNIQNSVSPDIQSQRENSYKSYHNLKEADDVISDAIMQVKRKRK